MPIENNTIPLVFEYNPANPFCRKGIENLFAIPLFENFKKTITKSDGTVLEEFDEGAKQRFETFVLGRNQASDFDLFKPLTRQILNVQKELGTT